VGMSDIVVRHQRLDSRISKVRVRVKVSVH
jgi:hypothetical protein